MTATADGLRRVARVALTSGSTAVGNSDSVLSPKPLLFKRIDRARGLNGRQTIAMNGSVLFHDAN
jgi:hypothetical protein